MSGGHLSKEFFELVKSIGESKSKQEEDRIIIHEVAQLKRKLNEVTASSSTSSSLVNKRKREFLIRLMYVEMLGHDASFGYIKAVEMTASTNLMQKRVGYLTCSLCLSPTHEFRFMIINQLQRDLQSSNHLEVCAALMAVCKLVTVEMVPAVQPMILDLLRHDAELVRKKAVMAIHRFHQLNPDSVSDVGDALRRTLCDRDPSVMGTTLCILHDLAEAIPTDYKDLVPSFVSILKQITEHRLPREFDYHRIPAPWIQIRLLKILALLGQADQQTSEGMYEVLHDVMRRADTGINVGYAIIYECVQTVTTIYPNSTLLDAAAASISRFISSDNHNLKYLGVTGLAAIVKDHPRYAAAHQMAVIDCLEDPDETLKRKTLDLLYRMTNPVNVEFISDKLTQFLREASDVFLRTELVSRITQCAERYAPSNAWYIQTMTNVFELGGDLVRPEVAHNLLRLIAEGSGEDEDQDMELRRDAVDTYLELLERPVLPDILVCTMAWVLGEYGYLSDAMELEEICERLVELVDRPFDQEDTTRGYVLSAVTKITAQMGHTIDMADAMMDKYKTSRSTDLQQRCFEYLALTKNFSLMNEVFPEDASCEDIDVDPNLSFLTSFVEKAAAQGAPLYDPPEDSDDEDEGYGHRRNGGDSNRLNFEAYKKPEIPYPTKLPPADQQGAFGVNKWGGNGGQGGMPGLGSSGGPDPTGGFGAGKRGVVKNVWGPTGLNTPDNAAPGAPGAPGAGAPGGYPSDPYNQGAAPGQAAYGGQHAYGGQGGYGGQPAYGAQPPQQPPQQEYGAPNSYDNGEPTSEDESNGNVDERQILASAIFGGIPGAPAPMPGARRVGSSTRSTLNSSRRPVRSSSKRSSNRNEQQLPPQPQAPVEQAPPPQQPKVEMDLLDISFDAPAAPQNIGMFQQPPPQQPIMNADPFGMGSPLAPAPAREASSPAPSASLDPFDMSGLGSSMNAAVELGKSPANGLDILGGSSSSTGVFQYNGRQLEPWQITTQDFGGRWGACPCEQKTKVNPSGIRTLEDFMGRMHQFNVHTVEAIPTTNEAIAACRLVNSEHVGLLHVKIRSGGFVDLTVRTADMEFTSQLLAATAQRLKCGLSDNVAEQQHGQVCRHHVEGWRIHVVVGHYAVACEVHSSGLISAQPMCTAGSTNIKLREALTLPLATKVSHQKRSGAVELEASFRVTRNPLLIDKLINMACAHCRAEPPSFPALTPKKTGQCPGEPSTGRKETQPVRAAPDAEESHATAAFRASCCDPHLPASANVRAQLRALNVRLLRAIAKTLEATMPPTDSMKTRARAVSSDNAKPTIVLNLPGVRLAVLTSAYDSLVHLDVTLSSAASLLLATYVACVLAWNVLAFVLTLLVQGAAFGLISFYTFMGCAMLSMNASRNAASVQNYYIAKPVTATASTLPLLRVDGGFIASKSTHVDKTDDAAASKRKERQAPAARRRVLAHLNKNRLLVNVVPGDMRRRVDMNLGEANIRVGKAFVQAVPGKRKPRDVYVMRVDCGAQSAGQEKHMNPVVMWDVTATFDEFKQLERELKKEVKAKKASRGVKVPHVSSGAVLFVQPELTDHVLNARRARLQTFIDIVRSDPVLSTMGCLRKFCQAY